VFVLLLVLGAIPVVAAAWLEGARWYAQRAADAAALAGAEQQVVIREVDARGIVYCETVAVDPVAAPQAAESYWRRDTASFPGFATLAWQAVPQGRTLTLQATVSVPPGGLEPLLGGASVSWSLLAEAEAVRVTDLPACA
jgi:hypothetical protein